MTAWPWCQSGQNVATHQAAQLHGFCGQFVDRFDHVLDRRQLDEREARQR